MATGLLAGLNASRVARGDAPIVLPVETMLGSLCRYITEADPDDYQPTNAAFGLMPPPPPGIRKKRERKLARSTRSLETLDRFLEERLPALAPATESRPVVP